MSPRSLAVFEPWWIVWRNRQPVRNALERAFLYHWSEEVEAALKNNRTQGRSPNTWVELSGRLFAGPPATDTPTSPDEGLDSLVTPVGQLLVAQVLGRSVDELTPPVERWLETAVASLLGLPSDHGGVRAYVAESFASNAEGATGPKEESAGEVENRELPPGVLEIAAGIEDILKRIKEEVAGEGQSNKLGTDM